MISDLCAQLLVQAKPREYINEFTMHMKFMSNNSLALYSLTLRLAINTRSVAKARSNWIKYSCHAGLQSLYQQTACLKYYDLIKMPPTAAAAATITATWHLHELAT